MLFPPLGAATLAGQLRHLGVETKVFDCTFGSFEQLRADLSAFRPEIVGIYAMVSLSRNAFAIATMVGTILPHSLLVAGGPLPTVFPRHYTQHFDAVFRGEADVSFPHFCVDYFDHGGSRASVGKLPLDTYGGLFIQSTDLQVDNPTVHHRESEMATFPLPDRSDFDHAAYQKEWRQQTGSATTSIIATLGCPFACDFCSKPIFVGAASTLSLPRSTRSACSATTACGWPTTPSHSIGPIWRSSAVALPTVR
jgi:anaerobic magnesium-protoporphyrin IX monomethyl ester cyclase